MRFGRELKGTHGAEAYQDDSGDSSAANDGDDDEKDNLSNQKIVQLAMDEANNAQKDDKSLPKISENPFYRSALENIRRERKELVKKAKQRATNEIKKTPKNDEVPKEAEKEEKQINEPEFLDVSKKFL